MIIKELSGFSLAEFEDTTYIKTVNKTGVLIFNLCLN